MSEEGRTKLPRGRLAKTHQVPRAVALKIYQHHSKLRGFVEDSGKTKTLLTEAGDKIDVLTGLEFAPYSRYLCRQHMKDGKIHDHVCVIDRNTGNQMNVEEYFSQQEIADQVRELQLIEAEANKMDNLEPVLKALEKKQKFEFDEGYDYLSPKDKVAYLRGVRDEIRKNPTMKKVVNQMLANLSEEKTKKATVKKVRADRANLLGTKEVKVFEVPDDSETGIPEERTRTVTLKWMSEQDARAHQAAVIHRVIKNLYRTWSEQEENIPKELKDATQEERDSYKTEVRFVNQKWQRNVFGKWQDITNKVSPEEREDAINKIKTREAYKQYDKSRLYKGGAGKQPPNIITTEKGVGHWSADKKGRGPVMMPARRAQYKNVTLGKGKSLKVSRVGPAGEVFFENRPLEKLNVGDKIRFKGKQGMIQTISGNKVKLVVYEPEGATFIGQDPVRGAAVSRKYTTGVGGTGERIEKRRLRMHENKKALRGYEYTDLSECFKCGGRFEDARQALAKTDQPFNFLNTEPFRGISKQSIADNEGLVQYKICQSCELDGYVESPMMSSQLAIDVKNAMKEGSVLSVDDGTYDVLTSSSSELGMWDSLDVMFNKHPKNQTGYMQGDFLSSMSPKELKVKTSEGKEDTIKVKMPTLPRKIKNPKLKEGESIWAWTPKLFKHTTKGMTLSVAEPTKEYTQRQLVSDPQMRHYMSKTMKEGNLGPEFKAITTASFSIINDDKKLTSVEKSTAYNDLYQTIKKMSNTEGGLSFLGEQNRIYTQLKHTKGTRQCTSCDAIQPMFVQRGFGQATQALCMQCEYDKARTQKPVRQGVIKDKKVTMQDPAGTPWKQRKTKPRGLRKTKKTDIKGKFGF